MIKYITLSLLLNTADVTALPPEPNKIEAGKRGKQHRGRRRAGGGLR